MFQHHDLKDAASLLGSESVSAQFSLPTSRRQVLPKSYKEKIHGRGAIEEKLVKYLRF